MPFFTSTPKRYYEEPSVFKLSHPSATPTQAPGNYKFIGVSWNDDKMGALNCFLEDENKLCVGFDASAFHDDRSGEIEVRFSTRLATMFLEMIERKSK